MWFLEETVPYRLHFLSYTGHIILKRTYGHTVVDEKDPYIRLVEAASQSTSEGNSLPQICLNDGSSHKFCSRSPRSLPCRSIPIEYV